MRKFLIIVLCKFYGFVKDATNAMGLLTILLSANAFTIIEYFRILVNHNKTINFPKIYEIVFVLLIMFITPIILLKGEKIEVIYQKFKNDAIISSKKGAWITFLYIITTFAFLASLIWL